MLEERKELMEGIAKLVDPVFAEKNKVITERQKLIRAFCKMAHNNGWLVKLVVNSSKKQLKAGYTHRILVCNESDVMSWEVHASEIIYFQAFVKSQKKYKANVLGTYSALDSIEIRGADVVTVTTPVQVFSEEADPIPDNHGYIFFKKSVKLPTEKVPVVVDALGKKVPNSIGKAELTVVDDKLIAQIRIPNATDEIRDYVMELYPYMIGDPHKMKENKPNPTRTVLSYTPTAIGLSPTGSSDPSIKKLKEAV